MYAALNSFTFGSLIPSRFIKKPINFVCFYFISPALISRSDTLNPHVVVCVCVCVVGGVVVVVGGHGGHDHRAVSMIAPT